MAVNSQKSIVVDFNGTVYRPFDENKTYFKIVTDYKISLIKGLKVGKLFRLLKTKTLLDETYKEIKAGRAEVKKIFEIFNENVIDGLPQQFIHSSIDEMAIIAKNDADERILSILKEERKAGTNTGILSAAYEYTIISILNLTQYGSENTFAYANIVGDTLALNEDGSAKGFNLRTYGKKADFLESEFAKKRGFRNIIYIGDSEDDLPCFDYATSNNGKAILPFFLIDLQLKNDQKATAFVENAVSKYGAFIPKDENDLGKFLKG
jgi:hypothetical protein